MKIQKFNESINKSYTKEDFNKYISEDDYYYRNEFTLNDVDNIIDEVDQLIKKLQIKITTNKYNL